MGPVQHLIEIRSMYPSLAKVEVPSQNLAATQQFKVWTFIVIGRYLGEFHTHWPGLYWLRRARRTGDFLIILRKKNKIEDTRQRGSSHGRLCALCPCLKWANGRNPFTPDFDYWESGIREWQQCWSYSVLQWRWFEVSVFFKPIIVIYDNKKMVNEVTKLWKL